jgi:hypothetical protein
MKAIVTSNSEKNITKLLLICASIISFASMYGCASKPFHIKPAPGNPPAARTATAERDGLSIEAAAITDEDYLYQTFEANLLLAGVLPVKVTITNQSAEPVNIKRAQFEVSTSGSQRYKAVTGKKAFERVFAYYDFTLYNKEGYKESRDEFSAYAFDVTTPIGAGQSRSGLMFFITSPEVTRAQEITFVARRLKSKEEKSDQGVVLKLN